MLRIFIFLSFIFLFLGVREFRRRFCNLLSLNPQGLHHLPWEVCEVSLLLNVFQAWQQRFGGFLGGVGRKEKQGRPFGHDGSSSQLPDFLPASAVPCNLFYSSAVLDGERAEFMVVVDL